MEKVVPQIPVPHSSNTQTQSTLKSQQVSYVKNHISHFDNSSCLINDKLVPDDDNTVRDNEGDVMEEDVRGNNEDTYKSKDQKIYERNTRKRESNENPEGKGEIKQVLKKVDQYSKGTEMGNLVSTCDDEMSSEDKVMGLPANKREMVEKVYKGMKLFLCDVDLKLMYGIYKLTFYSLGSVEDDPPSLSFVSGVLLLPTLRSAIVVRNLVVDGDFKLEMDEIGVKGGETRSTMDGIYGVIFHFVSLDWNTLSSKGLMIRVCFSIVDDCLPLVEEKFREVIQTNYYTKTKFNCKLTSEQVSQLVKNLCRDKTSLTKGEETHNRDTSREGRLVDYRGETLVVNHHPYPTYNPPPASPNPLSPTYNPPSDSQDPVYSPHPTYNPPPDSQDSVYTPHPTYNPPLVLMSTINLQTLYNPPPATRIPILGSVKGMVTLPTRIQVYCVV
uniref:DCD domain-containing protein n=1 Tax=Solanum lycopersicum TaxID=4081 RepID=A0A3Q7H3T5_SOLLC